MKKRGFTLIELIIVLVIVGILVSLAGCFKSCARTGAFGPEHTFEATCTRTYVDSSGGKGESHYMVATDQGVFECDNSFLLGIWNCDELYAKFLPGKRYRITTKGEKVVGMFFQEYPYVKSVYELKPGDIESVTYTPVGASGVHVVTNFVVVTNYVR